MSIKQYKVKFVIEENGSYMGPDRTEIFFVEGDNYRRNLEERYGAVHIFSATEIKGPQTLQREKEANESDAEMIKGAFILGIIVAIIAGLWILLNNVINFSLISKYDSRLYFSNITHFNSDYSIKATSNSATIDITYPEGYIKKGYKVKKNQIVAYNGYKDTETDRLTAIYLYDNGVKIYGYIKHAKNIDPLKSINSDVVSKVKTTINSRYKRDLESKIKLYQAKTKSEIEDYKNKNYEKISQLSNNKTRYFYSSKDADLVENIESKYYEDEINEKEFFKLGNEYYKRLK